MNNVIFEKLTSEELVEAIIKKLDIYLQEKTTQKQTEYLTRRQLADLLSIDLATVHRYSKEGIIPSYRLKGRIYFKLSEVEASMKQRPNLKEGRVS